MPVRPSPNDLRAVPYTVEEIDATGKPFAFVLSQRITRTRIGDEALIALANLTDRGKVAGIVNMRTPYATAMTDGRTALEIDPGGPATDEINAVWKRTRELLQ